MSDDRITFFYAPQSRAGGTLLLLEELGAPYDLHVLNLRTGDQRKPAYLAVNPMGKVPAIRHREALVTEQVAIFIYLADLFAGAGLAPPPGDPLRGPYLRWLVFYGSCFEPAITDRALKREPGPVSTMPYGDFETTFNTLDRQLAAGPYILGERFSAADVLWGSALSWITMWKLVPEAPAVLAYVERHKARPALARVNAREVEILASLEN